VGAGGGEGRGVGSKKTKISLFLYTHFLFLDPDPDLSSCQSLILLPGKPQEQVIDLMHFAEILGSECGVEIKISSIIMDFF